MIDEVDLWRPETTKDLQEALESAFPTAEKLDEFTQTTLGFPLGHFAAPGTTVSQALSLVECMRENGRMRELIRRAIGATPNNPLLLKLERDRLKVAFPWPVRAALVGLIEKARLPWVELIDAAEESLPNGARLDTLEPDAVWELIDRVEGLRARCGFKDVPLLLEMTARLALKCGTEGASLRQWCEVRVAERKLSKATWEAVEQHVRKARVTAPFLIVKLLGAGDRFAMQVWLGSEEGKSPRPLATSAEDEPKPTAELAEELRKLLTHQQVRAAMRAARQERLDIEFVLSCEDLEMPVEQWKIQKAREMEPLYLVHDVVVRPMERLYAAVQANVDPEFAAAVVPWEQRWRTFAALEAASFPAGVLWARDVATYKQRSFRVGLTRDSNVCLALSVVPVPGEQPPFDAVKRSVYFGMPAAVWLRRDCCVPDDVSASFGQMFTARDNIRKLVRDARNGAYEGKCAWGDHLVVLWDNLEHRPPDATEDDYEAP